MFKLSSALLLIVFLLVSIESHGENALSTAPSPAGAKLYIISPANGETVSQTFTVKFGLSGMGVAPAGVDKPNTGHHHLLIDSKELPQAGVPMGGNVMHFGGGQTEVELTLAPGEHSLQLVLGDKFHIPHLPMVLSDAIQIKVK